MSSIKVAIAGIGSCASSLYQMVSSARAGESLLGVGRPKLGGYGVSDIEIVAAFDVDDEKVGRTLDEAAFSAGNSAKRFVDIHRDAVVVRPGPLADGLEGNLEAVIVPHPDALQSNIKDVATALRESNADILVCFLPTGARAAVRLYAEASATARVAFVNGTPESIARDPYFQTLFREARCPLLGDDTKSMLGATTLHTALIELMHSKGIEVAGTYQINVGGNRDFLNLADVHRSATKVTSKRTALRATGIHADRVLAGPNGFVDYLADTKHCMISLVGRSVLGSAVRIDLRLEVEDSPNAAGTIVDAIRAARLAKDRGLCGEIAEPCGMLFKSPPLVMTNGDAVRRFQAFVGDDAG